MTAKDKIERLEALLARVQSRAAERRAATNGASVVPPVSVAPVTTKPSEPPSYIESLPPDAMMHDEDVDVEVSAEVVDIDIDVDEMGMPLESGAQPVAEHTILVDDGAGEEPPAVQAAANELEEPAPSSSPRPIVEPSESFEEESAPRHTPPPESGKQVAAPSASPAPRKSSLPPPSVEGHTLIGGWREPGIPAGGAGAPGVRVPGPTGAMPPEPVTATRAASIPPEGAAAGPEVTRAELPGAGAPVASFEGAAPAFQPSTFGDLLDATLGL